MCDKLNHSEMMITEQEAKDYLDLAKNLKGSNVFFDSHVHPFDVIQRQLLYHPNPLDQGVYSINGSKFVPPRPTEISLESESVNEEIASKGLYDRFLSMKIRRWYSHTGPEVFRSHMRLCGLDKVLLLPVAPTAGDIEDQMKAMLDIFGNSDEFIMGSSIPTAVDNEEVEDFLERMIRQFSVKAIKLHPNLSQINTSSTSGKERIERILSTCGEFSLPLVVHGGVSTVLQNHAARSYSTIEKLETINWGLSTETVVIAHAGSFECDPEDTENIIMPKLRKMLQSQDNLMIDISGLEFNALVTVLNNIAVERIIFGSDALYYSQWSVVVKLLRALQEVNADVEEDFMKIMSINPSQTVFKKN